MSRFAKIVEEVFKRYGEVTGEEFRLYCTIVFHTFVDTGICRKSLRQMAQIHALEYTRTTTRFKTLVKLKWCEKTKKGIRPLIGLNIAKKPTSENIDKMPTFGDEMLAKSQHESLQNANTNIDKMPTFGDEMLAKSQHTLKEYIEPFKDENFSTAAAEEKTVAEAAVETSSKKSKFLIEDCLRYAEFCVKRGDPIKNIAGYARYAYQTGKEDAFILAALYPEKIVVEQHIEYSDADYELSAALEILRDVLAEGDEDISSFEKYYSPELWQRLMGELQNVERES